MTLSEALRMTASKQASALDLTEAVLNKISSLDAQARAFITVTASEAIESAKKAGPAGLAGVPVAVKDLFDTEGIRTTAGAKIFETRIPAVDATVVRRLKEAGAVIVGKTNMHEFAFGVTNVNPHYGTPLNPWDAERICGGSSGGSACAVALSMAFGSVGTDTGGSIRIPASFCGIVGLKPTYGQLPLRRVIPLSWSLDHAGPMARTVEDAATLLDAISRQNGGEPRRYTDALTGNIKGVRIGIPRSYFFEQLAPEVDAALSAALITLERLGATMVEVELPGLDVHRAVWNQIAIPEAYSYHEHHLRDHADLYGSDVRARLEVGRALFSADYVRAQRFRSKMKLECSKILEAVDAIVTPTVPFPAPRIRDLDPPTIAGIARFTRFFNIVGLPAISIPCGFTTEGLPVGMQIAGPAFGEAAVLRIAYAYEQDTKWYERLENFS